MVCAVGVAGVGYFALNRPLTGWRLELANKAELVREKLSEGPALKAVHAEQERELAQLLERVEQVNRRVPNEPREGEFLAALSRTAEAHGVTIEDFRRGQSLDAATHSTVSVSINVRGPHEGLCQMLDMIAKLPRLAELTHLEIEGPANSEGYPAQLTYSLYYGMASSAMEADSL